MTAQIGFVDEIEDGRHPPESQMALSHNHRFARTEPSKTTQEGDAHLKPHDLGITVLLDYLLTYYFDTAHPGIDQGVLAASLPAPANPLARITE